MSTKKPVKKVIEELLETPVKEVKSEPKLLLEQELQLKAVERKVIGAFPGADLLVIENKLGGELYVSEKNEAFKPENVIQVGETREFEGVINLFIGSYGRPVFTLKHFKK